MAEVKEPDKCVKCTESITKQIPSLCTLCEAVKYCSVQCKTDDFTSHSHHCDSTAKNLQLQELCAVCPKPIKQYSGSSTSCDTCSGIIYCSSKCKDRNAEEHALFCKIYTDVRPRPSEAHRLHILFPALEDKMRFIWVPNCQDERSRQKALNDKVDLYEWGTERFAEFDESGFSGKKEFRLASGRFVKMFTRLHKSDQNRSLSLVVNGRPVSHIRGNVTLAASSLTFEDGGEDLVPIDMLPQDLPKLLRYLAREELRAGCKVKMELMDFDSDEDASVTDEGRLHERTVAPESALHTVDQTDAREHATATKFPFFRMPRELRDQIYHLNALDEDVVCYDIELRALEQPQKIAYAGRRPGSALQSSHFEDEYATAVGHRIKALMTGGDRNGLQLARPGSSHQGLRLRDIRLEVSTREREDTPVVRNLHALQLVIPLPYKVNRVGHPTTSGMFVTFRFPDTDELGPRSWLDCGWREKSGEPPSIVFPAEDYTIVEQILGVAKAINWRGAIREYMIWKRYIAQYIRV